MGLIVGSMLALGGLLILTPTRPSTHRMKFDLTKFALSLLAAMIAAGVFQLFTRNIMLALISALLTGWVPYYTATLKEKRHRAEVSRAWPDAVDFLASAIRSGIGITEALVLLSEKGPHVLRPMIELACEEVSAGGVVGALTRLQDLAADPVTDRICITLRAAHEVGGNQLVVVLRNLSGFLRSDQRTRGELIARQSWTVNAARLASGSPWVILLLLSLRPEAARFYSSGAGMSLIVGGAIATVIAYWWMVRISHLPHQMRLTAPARAR